MPPDRPSNPLARALVPAAAVTTLVTAVMVGTAGIAALAIGGPLPRIVEVAVALAVVGFVPLAILSSVLVLVQ